MASIMMLNEPFVNKPKGTVWIWKRNGRQRKTFCTFHEGYNMNDAPEWDLRVCSHKAKWNTGAVSIQSSYQQRKRSHAVTGLIKKTNAEFVLSRIPFVSHITFNLFEWNGTERSRMWTFTVNTIVNHLAYHAKCEQTLTEFEWILFYVVIVRR